MNPETYLPFDLETALKHPDRVICRNGHKPEWHYFESDKSNYPISFVDCYRKRQSATKEGHFYMDKSESPNDLFLLPPPEKTYWANVYRDYDGRVWTGCCYESEEEAKKETCSDYIKTISFTVPDEG